MIKKFLLLPLLYFFAAPVNATTFILNPIDLGYYTNEGFHDASNKTPVVGAAIKAPVVPETQYQLRNFFVYDLSSVSGIVTNATFEHVGEYVSVLNLPNTFTLYEVSTGIDELRAGHPENDAEGLSIYSDLGSGAILGSALVTSQLFSPNTLEVTLNQNAIGLLNASRGLIAFGGDYPDPDPQDPLNEEFVSFGDLNGTGIKRLILEVIPIPTAVGIDVAGGDVQECSQTEGAMVSATANITIDPSDAVSGITWLLDGQNAGNDTVFNQFVTLGTHQIEVTVTTVNGDSASDIATVTIEDTQPPIVTAQFINRLTGEPINTIQPSRNYIEINAEASDVCDPSAVVIDAIYGNPTSDGSVFLAIGFGSSLVTQQNQLVLRVTAQDASGNRASAFSVLSAP